MKMMNGQHGRLRTITSTHGLACSKNAKTDAEDFTLKSDASNQEFSKIYTFRYIVHTRVLSRLKIYQTLLTIGALPPSTYFHFTGDISTSNFCAFVGIASLATVMLYVMSSFFRRIVGIISVNRNFDIVRISHLTFWGHRNDVEFWTKDVVPMTDMTVNPNDVYQIIRFYDNPKCFYWFYKHVKNEDKDAILQIFGKI